MVKKATRISQFVAAVEDQPVVVGLDVHKKTYSVALFAKENGLVESYTCPSSEAALAHQLNELSINIEHVVYESGQPVSRSQEFLTDAGFNVSTIAASRIPRGYTAAAKNDRLDAVKLRKRVAAPHRGSGIRAEGDRSLVRRRKRIAESRGKIKQKIEGFLPASGIEEP
jgi:transposase